MSFKLSEAQIQKEFPDSIRCTKQEVSDKASEHTLREVIKHLTGLAKEIQDSLPYQTSEELYFRNAGKVTILIQVITKLEQSLASEGILRSDHIVDANKKVNPVKYGLKDYACQKCGQVVHRGHMHVCVTYLEEE